MKTLDHATRKFLAGGVAAVLLGCASLLSLAQANDAAVVRSAGAIRYVSGGVGGDSLEQLAAMARDFNVKLVFALASGDYLSDVRVLIADAQGHKLLDTVADGPWLLLRLPAGKYRIAATLGSQQQQREVSVGVTQSTTVDFRWAAP